MASSINNLEFSSEIITVLFDNAKNFQWNIKHLIASPLKGPAGNHEYLAWMCLRSKPNQMINSEYIQNLVNETL